MIDNTPLSQTKQNFKNRTLFHGDNLDFLRAMNSQTIDLIATDPPFKKGRDFHATPDSLASGAKFQDRWVWDDDVHPEWIDELEDDHPAVWAVIDWSRLTYGDDMGAFLCFMAVRLLEMERVLKPTGSLYLHCDPTASHYLKTLLDAVFGWKQFRNEIVWRRSSSHNSADKFGPIHDIILFYAKSEYTHNVLFKPYLNGYIQQYFNNKDDEGEYRETCLHGSGIRNGESGKPWKGFDPTEKGRHWAVPSELILANGIDPHLPQHKKLDALFDKGYIDIKTNYLPNYRQYLKDSKGVPLQDLWSYQPYTKGLLMNTAGEIDLDVRWIPERDKKERYGYPTQKPIGLYTRIIKSSTSSGDIVLDPFCGCATTCVAAEIHGRKWVGIDIWDKSGTAVAERLEREGLIKMGAEAKQGSLFAEDIHLTSDIPERTDNGETAVEKFVTPERRNIPKEPWQRMSRKAMFDALVNTQSISNGLCLCAGCGRELEPPFMELDHITPRSDRGSNDISNRILLCRPCNGRKNANLTLKGLIKENKKVGWMADANKAKCARELAETCYENIRYGENP